MGHLYYTKVRGTGSTMTIGKTRAEILRLIGRLGETPDDAPQPASRPRRIRRPRRPAGGGLDAETLRRRREHLSRQEDRLAELEFQREQLARLRAGGVEERLDDLERRVAKIETGDVAAPAPGRSAAAAMPSHRVSGRLRDGFMSDLLQLISSNDWTGTLVVGQDQNEIRVDFSEGEIWAAEAPGCSGEAAVFALMARVDDPFYFAEKDALSVTRTIEGNTQFLILEGLRRLDEASSDETE